MEAINTPVDSLPEYLSKTPAANENKPTPRIHFLFFMFSNLKCVNI